MRGFLLHFWLLCCFHFHNFFCRLWGRHSTQCFNLQLTFLGAENSTGTGAAKTSFRLQTPEDARAALHPAWAPWTFLSKSPRLSLPPLAVCSALPHPVQLLSGLCPAEWGGWGAPTALQAAALAARSAGPYVVLAVMFPGKMKCKDAVNDIASSEGSSQRSSQGFWSDGTWMAEERGLNKVRASSAKATGFSVFLKGERSAWVIRSGL